MLGVANLADGAIALHAELADFAGGHLDESVLAIAVGEDGLLTGRASNLAAGAGTNLNVVNSSTKGYVLEGHCVAYLGGNGLTALHGHAHGKTNGSQDVALGAIGILDKGNAAGTVGIILDSKHGGGIAAGAAEVHQTVVLLVTTANVASGDTAIVVAATALTDRLKQRLLRLALGDLVKRRKNLVAIGRCGRLE